jgi:hypothetical protein
MKSNEVYVEHGGHRKAFFFSPRVALLEYLIRIVGFYSRLNLGVKFFLNPIFENLDSNLSSGTSAIFANGYMLNNVEKYRALRLVFRRKGEKILGPGVLLESTRSDSKPAIDFIPYAEDPRLFYFRGQPFVYFQVPNDEISDCKIYIKDLVTSRTFRILSPFGFCGKNWIPFEYKGELFFVFGLHPLIIIKSSPLETDTVECSVYFSDAPEEVRFSWNDDDDRTFSSFRGGTSLIEIDDGTFVGFTHITPLSEYKDSHQLGFVRLYPNQWRVDLKVLSKLKSRYLIDPYAIEIDDSSIFAICSVATGNPSRFATVTADFKVGWRIDEILNWASARD